MDKAIDLTFLVTEQDGFPALVGLILGLRPSLLTLGRIQTRLVPLSLTRNLILLKDALTFGSIEIHIDACTTHTLNQRITQP